MRPIAGYINQGRDAWAEGVPYDRCPYPTGILKSIEWAIGWQEARLDLEDDEGERDDAQTELSALKASRTRLLQRAQMLLPTPARLASAAKMPVSRWPKNCYAVAEALAKSGLLKKLETEHGEPKVLYGVFHGDTGSVFGNRPQQHHGWLEFHTGLVVDPTRWVFEERPAEITATTAGEAYDLGGSRLRARSAPAEAPKFDKTQRTFVWKADRETDALVRDLLDVGRGWNGMLSLNQMFWLANLPVDRLHPRAQEVYRFFDEVGCIGMVPLDHRQYVGYEPAAAMPAP